MPTIISTKSLTLRQLWLMTYSRKRSRFEFNKRDVLKTIRVTEVKHFKKDRHLMPEVKFNIRSFSYPQYEPYKSLKGKKSAKQRKIKHEYQIILELDSLDFDSQLKWRVGSKRKWDHHPAQARIKTIYSETMAVMKRRYQDPKVLQDKIKKHKTRAEYLDVGDYNSRKRGLNGDFYFRIQPLLYDREMLFGPNWVSEGTKEKYLFLDKHTIGLVRYLLARGIISY